MAYCLIKCKKCKVSYADYEDDENYETELCSRCFEAALEDYEENRRRKIAESNEY